MQTIYANFNADDWHSVDPSDPNIYQYIVSSSFSGDYIYIKYDDGRYRYIQPISFGSSNDGNYHLFCYKDDGQKRRYSLNKIQNFLFEKSFISDYFNYEKDEEVVEEIIQDTPQDLSEDVSDLRTDSPQELPFDNQIEALEQAVSIEEQPQVEQIDEQKPVDLR